jgi:hypothetical protein
MKLTPDQIVQVQLAVAAGESMASIGRRFGCSKSNVQYHALKLREKQKAALPPADPQPYVNKVHKCPGCPLLFLNRRGQTRTYCSHECHLRVLRMEREFLFEEFLWIAGTDTWDKVSERLGFPTRSALAKWLERLGEREWVQRVNDTGMPRTYLRAA